ncbi:hypothetical protein JM18_003467 [Phytophthora kernoviae]|uniref:Uncharacterized protein n=2 Tax=Phytophthora kernoviae TaxID=325452 RepID=A0A8T0M345_9STRA|nr:hypothetical protein G195_004729 [Phytophthora kernoviae 00238/432]KAG2526392.1 hypothetical protein JM16_003836 [Phytophthora kernoviae]KAG2527907.1 hypothetical protein JM18_003467 [Phytophthora kernoviae]
MARPRIAVLVLLFLVISLTSASAFDWTFWNDDDNSEDASSTGTPETSESNAVTKGAFNLTGKTLSPELKKIAPSLFDSEEGSASASKKTAPVTPTASSGSVDTTTSGASDIDTSASGSFIDPSSDSFSGLVLANPIDAKSTIVSTYRNWVGPQSVAPDSACYREAHIMKTCPSNFNRHKLTGTCWTECPLEYPIECGLECIRQSDDCGMEVFWKTTAVVSTAMAGAAVALALELVKGARWIRTVLECGLMMIGVVRAIIRFVRGVKITDPTATRTRILDMVYQSNNVVTDLPMAIYMCKEYLQTICGPTQFIGDIDDGTDKATLGMNIVQDAFNGSTMSWTKKGDGAVVINFTSKDTKDVTVNIMSGGTKIGEVDVKKGGTAQWTSTVKALAGKTLYLDRWRPGFLGLPGTGGGSLLIWIPHASEGGHLDLAAQLNVS